MKNISLSAFIDEYSDNLDEQIDALKRYGIEYVELRHCGGKNVADFSTEDVINIKNAFDKAGIKVSAIGSPIGKIAVDGDMDAHLITAGRIFAMANILGAKCVRIFSFYLPKGSDPANYREQVLSNMQRIVDKAQEYDVILCHENEAGIYGESPENCLDLLEHFGGRLRCVFDMGNFVLDGYEPYPRAFNMLKEHIEYFHIKDALYEGAIVPAGMGEASIKDILTDYTSNCRGDVFITLEPHLQTFAGLNALVGKSFENPYKYENQQVAFDDGVSKLRQIIGG